MRQKDHERPIVVEWGDLRSALILYGNQERSKCSQAPLRSLANWNSREWEKVIGDAQRFFQVEAFVESYLSLAEYFREKDIHPWMHEGHPEWCFHFFASVHVFEQAIRFCIDHVRQRGWGTSGRYDSFLRAWNVYPRHPLSREHLLTLYAAHLDAEELELEGMPILRGVLQAVKEGRTAEEILEERNINRQHMDLTYFDSIRWMWDEAVYTLRAEVTK